ncbi:Methyltransferase-like protein 4 [Physocladia obscura]|uniref:Methyltransferase-like protein 4 n=1 Tax=Physocladia obscura TaxID=109957 RepID=A0AAD5T1I9_9FUNG|nr:Methyltransferase-like protein 4 [Physocladia obscura]
MLDSSPSTEHIGFYVARARGYYAGSGMALSIMTPQRARSQSSTFKIVQLDSVLDSDDADDSDVDSCCADSDDESIMQQDEPRDTVVPIASFIKAETASKVLATSPKFIQTNLRLVRAFLDATDRGFQFAAENPQEACKMMLDILDRDEEENDSGNDSDVGSALTAKSSFIRSSSVDIDDFEGASCVRMSIPALGGGVNASSMVITRFQARLNRYFLTRNTLPLSYEGRKAMDVEILKPENEVIANDGSDHAKFLKHNEFQLAQPYGYNSFEANDDTGDDEFPETFVRNFSEAAKKVKAMRERNPKTSSDASSENVVSGIESCSTSIESINWSQLLNNADTIPRDFRPLINKLCANPTLDSLKLTLEISRFKTSQVYIPPQCAFYISDIKQFPSSQYLLSANLGMNATEVTQKFSLIVADPPWPNLSVARSKSYKTMDPYTLFEIPVRDLLEENGGIIAVWITHNPRYRKFVRDKLFPAWGVREVAEWCWIKITTQGDLVFQNNGIGRPRRSYELLVVGQRGIQKNFINVGVDFIKNRDIIPVQKFFASVPSKMHSQKPFLDVLFQDIIPPDSFKLELFARIVRRGWTSWGNECLKFNEEIFLEDREYSGI